MKLDESTLGSTLVASSHAIQPLNVDAEYGRSLIVGQSMGSTVVKASG
jgi:hypothetical protein